MPISFLPIVVPFLSLADYALPPEVPPPAIDLCAPPAQTFVIRSTGAEQIAGFAAPEIWLVNHPAGQPAAETGEARSKAPLELWREDDGLFYVHGAVNGQTVRFLVDTGASMIVLTAEDAKKVGALQASAAETVTAETANGNSAMEKVTLLSMQIGQTDASSVPAVVSQGGLKVSLLGQNWLSHLGSVRIEGDRMLLQ